MEQLLTPLGLGGVVIYIVLKEYFSYRHRNKLPVMSPNPHPDRTKTGDLSATYWLSQFALLNEGLRRIEVLLAERLPK